MSNVNWPLLEVIDIIHGPVLKLIWTIEGLSYTKQIKTRNCNWIKRIWHIGCGRDVKFNKIPPGYRIEVDIVVDERFNDLGHLVKRVYL